MSGDCSCGCGGGAAHATPLPTANRPGLDALTYRVGTHSTFLAAMIAGLSSHRLEDGRRPLKRLTTRDPADPAIALLDAWATVGDVLTFYQERIANEGYLLTATERRSILELARLVGYELRPGVAASVHLAFTLDKDYDIEIPAGTAARSLPGPGELPQVFETDEPIRARTEWNALRPRLTRPARPRVGAGFTGTRELWLEGTSTALAPNDALLVVCGGSARPIAVRAVDPEPADGRTRITYAAFNPSIPDDDTPPVIESDDVPGEGSGGRPTSPLSRLAGVVQALRRDPSVPPPSRFQLARSPSRTYSAAADLAPQLIAKFDPRIARTLYDAYSRAPAPADPDAPGPCAVFALRARAAVFGHNIVPPTGASTPSILLAASGGSGGPGGGDAAMSVAAPLGARWIPLDAVYDGVTPGSWVVVDRVGFPAIATRVEHVLTRTRTVGGVALRVTELILEDSPWPGGDVTLDIIRSTTVHLLSEPLRLAETPIPTHVEGDEIELDGMYDGLEAGRWLVVRGERADVLDANGEMIEGIEADELVMLAGVTHGPVGRNASSDPDSDPVAGPGPDDRGGDTNGEAGASAEGVAAIGAARPIQSPAGPLHTRLVLAEPLAYAYRRATVTINANVAKASHGETRREALGNGDASESFQSFTAVGSPVTFVAAPTRTGVESSLEVRVDGVRWPRHDTLVHLGPGERGYIARRDDDGETTVIFGDGVRGARLPTGVENVTAVYRTGIGKPGNVEARRVSQLATRPLGVKEVINPRRASGGADAESRDQARRNVPLAVLALDRLVSVRDYADFARTFAGIGKASAASLSDGRREVVHLTIAGAEDIPIDPGSDLHRNLLLALAQYGDPNTALQIAVREAVFLLLSARVKIHEDHLWNDVEPRLRAALLEALGFERRDLGQSVHLSEVVSVMHGVAGVEYVDVDLFDGVSESDAADPEALGRRLEALAAGAGAGTAADASARDGDDGCGCAQPRRWIPVPLARVDPSVPDPDERIRPARVAYLNPELPDTLILTEMTS